MLRSCDDLVSETDFCLLGRPPPALTPSWGAAISPEDRHRTASTRTSSSRASPGRRWGREPGGRARGRWWLTTGMCLNAHCRVYFLCTGWCWYAGKHRYSSLVIMDIVLLTTLSMKAKLQLYRVIEIRELQHVVFPYYLFSPSTRVWAGCGAVAGGGRWRSGGDRRRRRTRSW